MIPGKIKSEVENSSGVKNVIGSIKDNGDWKKFTRTVFERIARKINIEVSRKVIESPYLVKDFILFGENEFENLQI